MAKRWIDKWALLASLNGEKETSQRGRPLSLNTAGKLEVLRALNEAQLRKEVILPLLRRIPGISDVQETHGANELGKDIVYRKTDALTTIHGAVVAKIGAISGAAGGKDTLSVVRTQVQQCFENPFYDLRTKEVHTVEEVYVWTSGAISSQARQQIVNQGATKLSHVHFFDGERTIELLEKFYPSFFTVRDPYVADYFHRVGEHHGRLEEVRGLGGTRRELAEVFVEPRFRKVEPDPSRIAGSSGKAKRPITFKQFAEEKKSILLLGDQGTGKTTTLRKVLLRVIKENLGQARRTPIPILVSASKVAFGQANGIERALDFEYCRFDQTGSATGVLADLEAGNILVLIDGLDELRDPTKISEARTSIVGFRRAYPSTRIIISSRRVHDLSDLGIPGFTSIEQEEFSEKQVTVFVNRWFSGDKNRASKLLQQLNEKLLARGLESTPLVLTLVAVLYDNGRQELPESLTELYTRFLELALGRWDSIRDIRSLVDWTIKSFVLRKMCWELQQSARASFSESELRDLAAKVLSERGQERNPNQIVDEILGRSELLYLNEEGLLQFKHISFQDYFAGVELAESADVQKLVCDRFLDARWDNTVFFACGLRPDSEAILQHILSDVHPSGADEELQYALHLGMCTQAVYLAPNAMKQQVLARVLSGLVNGWGTLGSDLVNKLSEIITVEEHRELNHFLAMFLFGIMARVSLGSPSFKSALQQEVVRCRPLQEIDDPRERAEEELRAFFIAAACSGCELFDEFIRMLEKDHISRPELLLIGTYFISVVKGYRWIEPLELQRLTKLEKRTLKRLRGTLPYLEQLKKQPPQPLPEPSLSTLE